MSFDNSTFSNDAFDDGVWHHVAIVRNSTAIKMFIDGEEEDVWVGSAVNIDYPFSLIIGTADDSAAWGFWSGVIDEVKILNKTLTAAEILEEFES